MPTEYLYPVSTLQNDGYTVHNAPTAHEAADDPHGSESTTTNNEGNSISQLLLRFGMDDMSAGQKEIKSVSVHAQLRSGNSLRIGAYIRIGGTNYLQVVNTADVTWEVIEGTPSVINPDTSAPWEVADLNAAEGAALTPGSFGVNYHLSALHFAVLYEVPSDSFAYLLGCWLPPLIAAASHMLTRSEIKWLLRNLKIQPANDEDFRRILEAFRVRPCLV